MEAAGRAAQAVPVARRAGRVRGPKGKGAIAVFLNGGCKGAEVEELARRVCRSTGYEKVQIWRAADLGLDADAYDDVWLPAFVDAIQGEGFEWGVVISTDRGAQDGRRELICTVEQYPVLWVAGPRPPKGGDGEARTWSWEETLTRFEEELPRAVASAGRRGTPYMWVINRERVDRYPRARLAAIAAKHRSNTARYHVGKLRDDIDDFD